MDQDENYNSSNSNSEENDEEIRCRCGQNIDSGSLMICCDKCEHWQHAECYFGARRDKMPEKFFCHICQPKQADMFKYIDNEELKNELMIDWLEYAKKNKKKRKKKKNQEDYNFNTKEVAVLERYWKPYCRNINNAELAENIMRAVGVLFNCKVAIIHEVFFNMAMDIQQLSQPCIIVGTDNKDPYSGWKLKNENIYTKVSDNITKPKETSDPKSLDNPLEQYLKVEKVNTWDDKMDGNNQTYIEYGVFTDKAIEQSQLIIEFYGKFTTWDAYRNLKGKLTKPNFRGFIFPDRGLCVDATKHGNLSRYIRRSCVPNAKVVEKWIDGKMRLGIFANSQIDVGNEITIPFDHTWKSLRNGLECACGKKETCHVYQWYQERKKLSDGFLDKNKIENIVKEPNDVVKVLPNVVDDLESEILLESVQDSANKNSKLSREERKLQAIVQTINKLERTGSPSRTIPTTPSYTATTTLNNTTPLKTSTSSLNTSKKNLFPDSPRNPSPSPNIMTNKKPLSLSSQNVNNLSNSGNGKNMFNRAKSPNNSSTSKVLSSSTPNKNNNNNNNTSTQNKRKLDSFVSKEDPKSKMVGKKAWMTKFLNEENESKSEENNNNSPNRVEDDSSSVVSPIDQQSMDKQNSPPRFDGNNNNNNNNINIQIKKEEDIKTLNGNENLIQINNNNINNNINNNNINNINTHHVIEDNVPPPNGDINQPAPPPPIENNHHNTNKRKLEEDNTSPIITNATPVPPPEPELPEQKKRRNSIEQDSFIKDNSLNGNTQQMHNNQTSSSSDVSHLKMETVNNQQILLSIPDNPVPSSVHDNPSHSNHINNGFSDINNNNKMNNFISLNGSSVGGYNGFEHQPNGIYNVPSQNLTIDPAKNN